MNRLVIKEGPLVLVRNIITTEIIIGIVLYAVSFLANYEQLYRGIPLLKAFRYDLFIMLAFSLFQVGAVLFVFLLWYFSYFEIKDREITRRRGIFSRRGTTMPLSSFVSVTTRQGIFERIINHATIELDRADDSRLLIRNVENVYDIVPVIKRTLDRIHGRRGESIPLNELLKQDEHERLEFKETYRFDVRQGKVSKDVERAALKTIAGFLNGGGGVLVLGVNDKREVTGISPDFDTLNRKDRDGFHNHLNLSLKSNLGARFVPFVRPRFESHEGREVCVVEVDAAHEPVYVSVGDSKEEFFVRTGNSTTSLSLSEVQNYISNRFRK
jgi:hypothetical protein